MASSTTRDHKSLEFFNSIQWQLITMTPEMFVTITLFEIRCLLSICIVVGVLVIGQ